MVFSMNMQAGELNVLGKDTIKNCEAGRAIWRKESFDKLMVVGGIFCLKSIQTIPISTLMAKWFEDQGIKKDQILTEEESKDTWGNIENALKILPKDSDITAVSQWQHMMRVVLIFKLGYGINVRTHAAMFFPGFKRFIMEWAYLALTIFDPRGASWFAKVNRTRRSQEAN